MNKTPSPFKTYARFKPISTKENDICINSLITSTQNSISIDTQSFPFTKVFKSSQAEIFDALLPSIIKDCINGYNSSLITFGSAESGKSFTLMGPAYSLYDNESEYHGIIPRFIKYIYDDSKMTALINAAAVHIGVNFEAIEVDSNKVNDLLKELNVFNKKNSLYTKAELSNYQNAKNTLLQGFKNRNVSNKDATLIYAFTIDSVVTSKLTDKINSHQGKIMFVDLANSNSKSVGVLTNVMNMLIKKYKYIDFASNKLTSLLQPCICGDYKTNFISTISQSVINISDTLSVLDMNKKIGELCNEVTQHENLKDALQLMVKENSKIKDSMNKNKEEVSSSSNTNLFRSMTMNNIRKIDDKNTNDNSNKGNSNAINDNLKLLLSDEMIKSFIEKKSQFDKLVNDISEKANCINVNNTESNDIYITKRLLQEVKSISSVREMENSLIETFNKIDFNKILTFINSTDDTELKNIFNNYMSMCSNLVYKSKEEELICKLNEKSMENFVLKNYIAKKNSNDKVIKINQEMLSKMSDCVFDNYEKEEKEKLTLKFFDDIVSSFIDFKEKSLQLEKEVKQNELLLLEKNEEISKLTSQLELETSKLQIANEKIKSMENSIVICNKSILAFKAQIDQIVKEVNFDDIYIQISNVNVKVEALFERYEKDLSNIGSFLNKTSKKIFDLPILKTGSSSRVSFIELKNKEKELNSKNAKIEDLTKQNTSLKNDIIKLKGEIVKLKKEIEESIKDKERYEKEKKEFEKKLKDAETTNANIVKEKNEQISKIQNELFETNKIKKEIEQKVLEVEEKSQELNNKLEEALVQKLKIQTEKENLNSSLKESNMKLTKAQEEINGLIVEKKEQIEKMSNAINGLKEEKEKIAKQREEDERRHIEISNQMKETQRQIEKSKEESEYRLKSELHKLTMEKMNLEKKTVEYEAREKNLSSQVQSLENQREELNKEKETLEKEKYQKIQENTQLSEKVKEILSQLSKIQQEKEEVDSNLTKTKEKLSQTEKEMKEIIAQKENQIIEVNKKLSELEKQREELLTKKKQVEENCSSLTEKINELLKQLKQLEEEKSLMDKSKEEQLSDITKRINSMNSLIESLQKELNANEEVRKELERKKEEYEKNNESLIEQKASLEKHLTEMKEQMTQQEEKYKKEITNYQLSSQNLNSTIDKLTKEKEKISKEKSVIQSQATELSKKVKSLNKEKEKVESEKKYLNTTVSSLLEELDTYKSSDFQMMKIQNEKFKSKFKSIFGKNLDIESFLSNESNNVSIKWDQTTLSKLTQKILQLREEKKTLSNDILLLQSDLNKTLSGSLAESQFTLLMKIKEENRKLRKEIANIKKRYSKLETEIKLAYYSSLDQSEIDNNEILQNNYYDIIAKIIEDETGQPNEENSVVWKGKIEDNSKSSSTKKKNVGFVDNKPSGLYAKSNTVTEESTKKGKVMKTKSANLSSSGKKKVSSFNKK